MLDRLLYLNQIWRNAPSTILHQEITIYFLIWSNMSMDRDFRPTIELKYPTEEWLKEQAELFYFTGIKKFQDCQKWCIDKGSNYVEK